MRRFLVIGLLSLFAFPLFSQTSTKVAPDCTIAAVFTTTGNSANFDNRSGNSVPSGPPCTIWSLTWSAQSAATSITINIEGAPDSNGTPGSFVSLANSSTFPAGILTYPSSGSYAYSPWMRITVSALGSTGQVNAVLLGWKQDQASISGGGGGGGSGCVGTIATPCVIGGNGNGSDTVVTVGPSQAAISVSAGTDLRIVTGVSGKTTRLTLLGFAWDNAATLTIREGTTVSTPCDTSTTTISGPWGNANLTALFQDYGADYSPLLTTSADLDICLHWSTSVTGGGEVRYSQY